MTFYHFVNCIALAYAPYHLTYKLLGLSEYGAFWKCVSAGAMYMVTQLAKMLFLATFFPTSDDGDDLFHDEVVAFDPFAEFLKLTVDLVDLFGLYLIMQRVSGKGLVKVFVAGLGWAFAELLFSRVVYLWLGARGTEFDWKYMQKSFDSNISLVHYLTLACLVWLWMRRDLDSKMVPVLSVLVLVCSYKTLLLEAFVHGLGLDVWTALASKALVTLGCGVVTLWVYAGITANDKY